MVLIDDYDLTPDAPPMLKLLDASGDSLKVGWDEDEGTEYRLEWPTELGAWSGCIVTPPVIRTSLRAGRRYDFRLRQRPKGTEGWSAPGFVEAFSTSFEMPVPLDASCVTVEVTSTSAKVSWKDADADASGEIQRYRLKVYDSNGASEMDDTAEPYADVFTTKPSCEVSNLQAGAHYVAAVYRLAFNQWGMASRYFVFTTQKTPPGTIHVRDVEIGERGANTVHLHWRVPVLNGSEIQYYEVACRYAQPGAVEEERIERFERIPMAELKDLPADAAVTLRIRSTNAGGTSAWSQWITTRTLCPSAFATQLTLLEHTLDSLRVSWRLIPTRLHKVVGFRLEGKRGDFPYTTLCDIDVTDPSDGDRQYEYTLEPLPPAAECHFRLLVNVLRDNETVTSPPGEVHTFTTLASRPARPDPPSFIIDYQGPKFKWTAPAGRGSAIAGYRIRVPGHLEDVDVDAGTLYWLPPAHLLNKEEGFQYEVAVAAVNDVGMSAWSEPCRVRVDKRGELNPVSFNSAKA